MEVPSKSTTEIDRLLAEQRRLWQCGARPVAEEFVAKYPLMLAGSEELLDLVYHEYLLRDELQDAPDLSDYQRRFPAVADLLCRQVALHCALVAAAPSASATTEIGGTGQTPESDDASVDANRYPQVPGYEVIDRIGSGGMGVVFHARQVSLGRSVALKFLRNAHFADRDQRSRFQAEAAAVARLRHPNIVQIHDYGVVDGCPYLVLELVEGGTLAQRTAGVPQSAQKCVDDVAQLAVAVQHAHELGLVHRDLKPANILITPDGVLKIADFGLVKQLEIAPGAAGPTIAGSAVMGTPGYMAPEQVDERAGTIGPPTDVYALGVILFELLSGQLPFAGDSVFELLRQIQESDPVLLRQLRPDAPRDLETICSKCLEKDPALRYPSAAALAGELRRLRSGEPITARPIGRVERVTRWCRRYPAVTGLAVSLALTVLSGLIIVSILWWRAEQLRNVAEANLQQSRANLKLAIGAVDKFCSRVTEDPRLMENDLRPLRHHLLQTAVEFHRQLVTQRGRSADSKLDLARANARLGRLTSEIGAGKEAIDSFRTAIRLFEQVAETRIDTLESFVADWCECQSDLGLLYENQGSPDRAEDAYQQVIQRLSEYDSEDRFRNPSEQLFNPPQSMFPGTSPDGLSNRVPAGRPGSFAAPRSIVMARVWGRLSALYRHFGDADKAEAPQLEALRLCESLLMTAPEDPTVRAELVIACTQLGELYQYGLLRRWREAQPYYDRALQLQTALLQSEPDSASLIATQVRILRNLARGFVLAGSFADARPRLQQAIEIQQQLVARHPSVNVYRAGLAHLWDDVGQLFASDQKYEQAAAPWRQSAEMWKQLTQADPANTSYANYFGRSQSHLAELEMAEGHIHDAIVAWNAAGTTLREVLRRAPQQETAQSFLAAVLERRARALAELHRYDEAIQDWTDAERFGDPLLQPWCRSQRAIARAQAGDDRGAAEDAESVVASQHPGHLGSGRCLREAAKALCLAAHATGVSDEQASANQLERQQLYQSRAIEILSQLLDAETITWAEIDQSPEFQSLQSHVDYRQLAPEHD